MSAGFHLSIQDSTLVGAAGEYYVLARLCLRNKIAALAPSGVRNADIVISTTEGDRLCALQVKARRDIGTDKGWHMKKKHEELFSDRLFYAFVDFGNSNDKNPTTYVVPSTVVATTLRETHQLWLDRPGKKGQPHKQTELRRFMPDFTRNCGPGTAYGPGWLEQYRERWDLLD